MYPKQNLNNLSLSFFFSFSCSFPSFFFSLTLSLSLFLLSLSFLESFSCLTPFFYSLSLLLLSFSHFTLFFFYCLFFPHFIFLFSPFFPILTFCVPFRSFPSCILLPLFLNFFNYQYLFLKFVVIGKP